MNIKRSSTARRTVFVRVATGVFLAAGGIKFRLTDHFHRRHDFEGVALRLWLACVLIGVASAVIAITVDLVASSSYAYRVDLCNAVDDTEPAKRYALWLGSAAVLAFLSSSLLRWVPSAAGSGLPEVKMALSGIVLFDSMATKVLLIKPLSLALALASSLSIGKEGPFVHCACCIAYLLVNSGMIRFSSLVREQRELEALVAACAAGVVCTFGAPVGGVLFSAEIIATGYYHIEHLGRAFFCVTLALTFVLVCVRPLLLALKLRDPLALFTTSFPVHEVTPVEVVAFALQGAIGAVVAAGVLHAVKLVSGIRPLLKKAHYALIVPSLVAMLCSAANLALAGGNCTGSYAEGSGITLDRLFNSPRRGADAHEAAAAADGLETPALLQLLAFGLVKLYVLSPLSLSMPTPTGVFLPTYVGGAALGLLSGILLRRVLPLTFASVVPGHFAVTGAAVLACASTRTMSTAVVTIELTGQLALQVPVLVATTTAYLVARILGTPSLFDAFVAIKKLPGATEKGVPLSADGPLTRSSSTLTDVDDYLERVSVPRFISRNEIEALLQQQSSAWVFTGISLVPIVASQADPILLGCVHVDVLSQMAGDEGTPAVPTNRRPQSRSSTIAPAEQQVAAALGGNGGDGGSRPPTGAPAPVYEDGGPTGFGDEGDESTRRMDLLYAADGSMRPGVDMAPLTVSKLTKLARISSLFRMLGTANAFVLDEGRLHGLLTRVALFRIEAKLMRQEDEESREASFKKNRGVRVRDSCVVAV